MTLNGQTLVTWTQSSVSTPTVYPIFILVVFLSWAWYEFVFFFLNWVTKAKDLPLLQSNPS